MGKCCDIDTLEYDHLLKCSNYHYGMHDKQTIVIVNPTEKTRLPRKEKKRLKKTGINKDMLKLFSVIGWHKNKNMTARIDHLGQLIVTQYYD